MEARDKARRAKQKVKSLLAGVAAVQGVGLTTVGGAYAIKVNLRRSVDDPAALPREVDGIAVVYAVVGDVAAQEHGDRDGSP